MPCSGERVTVSLDTTQGGGDEHDRGRRQRREREAVQQAPGLWRTDLQRQDLSVPGREVVQSRVDIGPKCRWSSTRIRVKRSSTSSKGRLEYQIEGQPPMTFNAGDALTVAGAVHAVRNVGSGNAAVLATYVVEKGKPLLTLVE